MLYRCGLALLAFVVAFGNLKAEEPAEQILFEVRLVAVSRTLFEQLKDDFGVHEKKVLLANDRSLAALLEAVQGDRDSNILQAPRVATLVGQPATVQIGEQHALKTGARVAVKNGQVVIEPEMTVVETGLKLMVGTQAPSSNGGAGVRLNSVDLDLQVISSRLGKIERVPVKVERQTQVVEKAEVLRNTVERKMNLPFDRTAIITGWWEEAKGKTEPQRMIVCVTARTVP